jgi:hypothetical protein
MKEKEKQREKEIEKVRVKQGESVCVTDRQTER